VHRHAPPLPLPLLPSPRPEQDWWFVSFGPDLRKPSGREARAFAVETVAHPAPAGYHKPFDWHQQDFMGPVYARMRRIAEEAVREAWL
jgi:hypothetical protein